MPLLRRVASQSRWPRASHHSLFVSLGGNLGCGSRSTDGVSRGTNEVELDENEAGGQPKNLKAQFELSLVDTVMARVNCAEKMLTFCES